MNLDAYFARIAYPRQPTKNFASLRDLHRAHVTAIPFENLDIQMERPIDLALDRLEEKLVVGRRGGYCFEHNTLLFAVLQVIGFQVVACEARVSDSGSAAMPRTHMLLVVSLDGREWLCDVGFGGDTPLEPVPLDGAPSRQEGVAYRVVSQRHELTLQATVGESWIDQYAFEPTPRLAIDFQVANWYTSTHPESRFVKTLTAQRRTPTGSSVLRDLHWTRRSGTRLEGRDIERSELERFLASEFGLLVPAGTRFRALDGDRAP